MDEIATLKDVPLFHGMDDAELAALRGVMETLAFAPGETIIREGEDGDYFYVILRGTVQFVSSDAHGQELILDLAGPGGFFGELSMLTGEKRSVRVRAAEEVVALGLDRDQFHDYLLKHPHAAIDVLTALGRRLYTTDRLLRQSVVPNVNVVHRDKLTVGQRVADSFAAVIGSWRFIIIQSILLGLWMAANVILSYTVADYAWDKYPFILLNLVLSFQAAYAGPIIMMSQNRSADKDRLAAEIDHEVNIRAEVKTGQILGRLKEIELAMHRLHAEQLKQIKQAQTGPTTG